MFHRHTACRWLFISLIAFSLTLSGCGEGEDRETVYMHVFNGYVGTESIDVFGPAGPVVTDLPFGRRTAEPVAVDRSLGMDFQVILEGAPEPFDIQPNLFTLYPQETATLVVSQREEQNVTTKVLRHQQSISEDCRLVIDNSLSLLSQGLGNYDFILGWEMSENLTTAGFDEGFEEETLDDEDQRPDVYNEIANHPYFGVRTGDDSEQGQGWVWLGPEDEADFPRIDFEGGSVVAPRSSLEYAQCIEEQEQAEEMVENADGDVDPSVMEAANVDCTEPQTYTVTTYEPGQEDILQSIHYSPAAVGNQDGDCSADHRIFNDFSTIFEGEHDDGQRIDHTTEFSTADHYFLVLYGRPVNPLLETWRASDHFTELPDYPDE